MSSLALLCSASPLEHAGGRSHQLSGWVFILVALMPIFLVLFLYLVASAYRYHVRHILNILCVANFCLTNLY